MNFYKRYVGDIQRDTGHLSLAEFGAYDRLLDHYYATEMPLPTDVDACCRIARAMTAPERKAVESILKQYFKLTDAGYTQARTEKEIADAQPLMVAARLNGKKGGRPKKEPNNNPEITQEKPSGFSKNNPEQTQVESSPEPEPDNPMVSTHSNETNTSNGVMTAGSVCSAIKRFYDSNNKSIVGMSPSNQKFLACLKAGATEEEFLDAARVAMLNGKEFAYIVGVVAKRRQEAANLNLHQGAMPINSAHRDSGRQVAAASVFTAENTKHLTGSNEIEVIEAEVIGHEQKQLTH